MQVDVMPRPHWASLVSPLVDFPQALSYDHLFILSLKEAAQKGARI